MADTARQISARRRARDRVASLAINAAGSAVIILILMILAYLIYVTLPLSEEAEVAGTEVIEFDAGRSVFVAADGQLWTLPGPSQAVPPRALTSGRWAVAIADDELRIYALEPTPTTPADNPGGAAIATRRLTDSSRQIRPDTLVIAGEGEELMLAYYDKADALEVQWLHFSDRSSAPLRRSWSLAQAPLSEATLLLDPGKKQLLLVADSRYVRVELPMDSTDPIQHAGVLAGLESGVTQRAWGPDRETLLVVDGEQRLHRFDTGRDTLPPLGAPLEIATQPVWLASEMERRLSYLLASSGELLIIIPSSGDELFRGSCHDHLQLVEIGAFQL